MMKFVRIGIGALMIALGLMMIVMVIRSDAEGDRMQATIAPLGLIGAGAMAISLSRKPPKKW